jgi:hypothetical protein
MRENCTYGSEGGEGQRPSLPLSPDARTMPNSWRKALRFSALPYPPTFSPDESTQGIDKKVNKTK